MGFFMAIALVVIAGGIGVFVIERLKYKYNQGTLGKKKLKSIQYLLDSLIPLGMFCGCSISIISGIFVPVFY
ncbi:hypothetical protein GCM10007111_03560 [Virgibacillus kapii]|uniref:Uncharacterized protein n=2 Tax=Virgibacillus TaxID=84406 RepID=A0A024QCR0_9BACI|nr:hypothetical protein GCM10007111_03560 [Virgibacillus kapii]CDQ40027.1 hypothetical protein BN990_02345 [Virgibacillus massiliensis]